MNQRLAQKFLGTDQEF